MKTPINIAKCLRIFFGVARMLTVILTVLVIGGYSFMGALHTKSGKPNYFPVLMPELSLRLNDEAIQIQTETSDAADIRVGSLVGSLSINTKSKDSALATRAKWAMFPVLIFGYTYYFLLFSFLRKLCANIEVGEVFNDANLCLVRNIGRLLVICGLVGEALRIMTYFVIDSYLTQHATITGLNATLDSGIFRHLQISYVITGLLVLLIAEAFRQGLALKKENDLVV